MQDCMGRATLMAELGAARQVTAAGRHPDREPPGGGMRKEVTSGNAVRYELVAPLWADDVSSCGRRCQTAAFAVSRSSTGA